LCESLPHTTVLLQPDSTSAISGDRAHQDRNKFGTGRAICLRKKIATGRQILHKTSSLCLLYFHRKRSTVIRTDHFFGRTSGSCLTHCSIPRRPASKSDRRESTSIGSTVSVGAHSKLQRNRLHSFRTETASNAYLAWKESRR
jgi:hypothetical protein